MARESDISDIQSSRISRLIQINKAFAAKAKVNIDGIIFNLYCDVDLNLWRPLGMIGSDNPRTRPFLPKIAFPWTSVATIDAWSERGEVVEVKCGSTVEIVDVITAPMNPEYGDLDLIDHRELKLVRFRVVYPDGKVVFPQPPLILLRSTAARAHIEVEDYYASYLALVSRLEGALGVSDLERAFYGSIEDWPKPPLHLSSTLRKALVAFRAMIAEDDEHAPVAFGYLMGRAEAEQQLLPLAYREHHAAQGRVKGGKVRRTTSRARTEPLREEAMRVIEGERNISLTACAKAVANVVASNPDWDMSTDVNWISRQIRELFEKRDLNGKVEYRPRADLTA